MPIANPILKEKIEKKPVKKKRQKNQSAWPAKFITRVLRPV